MCGPRGVSNNTRRLVERRVGPVYFGTAKVRQRYGLGVIRRRPGAAGHLTGRREDRPGRPRCRVRAPGGVHRPLHASRECDDLVSARPARGKPGADVGEVWPCQEHSLEPGCAVMLAGSEGAAGNS